MQKYGFVYIWKETKLKKYYIGSHWGTEDDRYICSSNSMRRQYERYPENFKRRILKRICTNRQDLLKEEQRWLDMIRSEEFGRKYYNINARATDYAWWMNEETKKLVSKKFGDSIRKKYSSDPEYRKKASKAGSMPWITNGISNKKLKPGMKMPIDWKFGRISPPTVSITLKKKYKEDFHFRNNHPNQTTIMITNGINNTRIKKGQLPPKGWKFGMTPWNKSRECNGI